MAKKYGGYDDTRPFNSSLAYLERLEKRWEDCDQAKLVGDLLQYFRSLHTIFMNTNPFFKETEERANLRKIIKTCEEEIKHSKMLGSSAQAMVLTDLEKELDKLREYLVYLLFKYKVTYVQIEQKNIAEEIKSDYQ